ncbi:MAG: RNA polymerase sigma factor SigM [Nocardioidaceae bacterium]
MTDDLSARPVDLDEADDKELLRRHVAGDVDAFGLLVRRHQDRMWAVAMRTLGDREEASDALQDALISAFRRAESYRGDAAVTTWLHRIVVNACLDRVRRRKARPAIPLPEDADRAAELATEEPVDSASAREDRLDVLAALRTLGDEQRAALVLVDMEGYSIEEAAALLDCPTGTVKSRCARGRAKLLPLLEHLGPAATGRNRSAPQSVPSSVGGAPTAPTRTDDRQGGEDG